MTYCVGVKLSAGIVMMSDTRTNAGIDNISRFRKAFSWEEPGERVLTVCTAGNLSVTQGVLSAVNGAIRREPTDGGETILNAPTLYRVAEIFGQEMVRMQSLHGPQLAAQGVSADASILLGGQRRGGEPRLYLIYSAGNFVEATEDTPFLQIGEHKYGKPILDRVVTPATPLPQALKAVFLSMASTIRSNLSVGAPLDLTVMKSDEMRLSVMRRVEEADEDYVAISDGWSAALLDAVERLPEVADR
ncbi:MAG: peptidase [Pseudomonadota bacterium]